MNTTCNHLPFKCNELCENCYGFIPTENCSPYSNPLFDKYISCTYKINYNLPGFCLCKNGKIENRVGCYHKPFTCIDICLDSVIRECNTIVYEPISTFQGNCSNSLLIHNNVKEGINVYFIVSPPQLQKYVGGMKAYSNEYVFYYYL